ncbi:MAG: lipid II flippase MurJ [Sporichthyaceae bacterium]
MSVRRALVVPAGLAGAALLIAGVTALSRVLGFGRWLVFSETVTDSCLGTAYSTANMLPNIVFEVVAGGALASAVVPLIGAQLGRGDAESVRRTASALLTWSVLVLTPIALLGMAVAGPLMSALIGTPRGCDGLSAVDVATRMFVFFAPQIPMYGLAVVCGGILNAHRRFLAAAAAPLVSTAVVISAYVALGIGYEGSRDDLTALPRRWEVVLAAGTTAGVLALAITTVLPVARLRLRLRPTLRFPTGVAPQARALAIAGIAGLVAQQVSVLVVIVLANREGGALNLYQYAWAVYLLPYAVLAVPIATSAFTALAQQTGRDDYTAFTRITAATTRAVVLVSLVGAALLAGTAEPVARMFLAGADGTAAPWQLGWALAAFAPGLVGYGLVAHLGRVLYAQHAGRAAAFATVTGWVVVALASIVLVAVVPVRWTVPAIGAANSIGMLVAAALLLGALARRTGGGSLAGVARAAGAGVVGAVLGAGAAAGAAAVLALDGKLANGLLACALAVLAGAVCAGVVLVLDGRDLRALISRRYADG